MGTKWEYTFKYLFEIFKNIIKSANLFRFVPNKINDEHLLIEGKLPESMGELQLICPGIFA